MKMVFRWYGENDPVTLDNIRQIPSMSGVVTAVYDVPAGDVWKNESILELKKQAENKGLSFKVIESVPVHEDIKLGTGNCKQYIENYCENIRRLGRAGVEVICYNFMPVFDWLRSDLQKVGKDGSTSLAYDNKTVLDMDPSKKELSLPGWDESYSKDELNILLEKYKNIDETKLWQNFANFINAVIPVCEKEGVLMAIHPDDPPWGIFGLPRIITGRDSYVKLTQINNSKANGITFCTGSLGANPENQLPELIREFGDKIHFAHIRNILITGYKNFEESAHPSDYGSLDIYEIVKALYDVGFDGYARPDHGRMIWNETGRPGYGLYDRALGAVYITGLYEAIRKGNK